MAGVAFLVGIETYDDEHFDSLRTGYDVDAIAEKLESQNSKYKLIKDPLKGQITIDELKRELTNFLSEQRGDALIYFSGHGYQVDLGEGTSPVGYLATSNCKLAVIDKQIVGQRFGLPLSYLNQRIHESHLNSVVLLLDACHSGQFLEEAIVKASFQPKTTLNYHIITSCLSSQSSYMDNGTVQDGKSEGLSVFTDALLEGLSEGNADANGKITSAQLFRSIEEKLNKSKYKQQPIQMALYRNSIVLMEYKLSTKVTKPIIEPIRDQITHEILCPYQGLQTFDEEQKEFFFGRERLVQILREKLKKQIAFLPIIGASGSGKSSVVRAGLIPLLKEENWQILPSIKPDRRPLEKLKDALREFCKYVANDVEENKELPYNIIENFKDNPSPDQLKEILSRLSDSKRFLLLIDQFEELFTLDSSDGKPSEDNQRERLKNERIQFIDLITKVTEISNSPIAVATTMRADFIEPCLHYPDLHNIIQNHAVFMPPLVGEDLIDAIEKPAQRQGYQVERKLVTDLAAEVRKEPGSLPLLEFALTQLWEQRDEQRKTLTYAAYTKLGGEVTGYEEKSGLKRALNLHANRVYDFWVDDTKDKNNPNKPRQDYEKEWIKRIFLRLVRTGQGNTDTRQRQPKANLLMIAGRNEQKQQELVRLIDDLVKGRLLVTGEADIGQLEQPDNQLNSEEFQKLAQENQIVDLAHEALIDGWQQFAKWREEDRDLRRLSERLEDARLEWEKDGKDENLEKQDQNRNLMMGGLLAHVRSQWDALQPYLRFPEADENFYKLSATHEQERIEKLERALAESRLQLQANYVERLVAVNQPLESLILAIQTVGENLEKLPDKSIGVVQARLREVVEKIYTSPTPYGHTSYVTSVAFSPDGQTIVSGSYDNTIRLWKLDGTPVGNPFTGHTSYVTSVAFSPDGQTIVSGSYDNTIRLWNLDGTPVGNPFTGHNSTVLSVAFSPDGQTIVSGSDDKTIRLWKLDGTPVGNPFTGHTNSVTSVAFSPDGQTIVSGSGDDTIRLWKLDGTPVGNPFTGHTNSVLSVAFSPDGQTIVSGSGDDTIRLWKLDGTPVGNPFTGHTSYVLSVAFSPDGQTIVSGSGDDTIRLWNLDGTPVGNPFTGHTNSVLSVAFSPDGQTIVSGSGDDTIRLWKLDGTPVGNPFTGHTNSVTSVAFSPDGQTIVSGSRDDTIRLWKLDGTPVGNPFTGHTSYVLSVAFSPDGQTIVSGSGDDTIRLWKLDGTPVGNPFTGHTSYVLSVAFSPDGQTIVSGSGDDTIRLWNLDGTPVGNPFTGHTNSVLSVAFSPDGQTIVSGSDDKTIRLWNLDGTPVGNPFTGHTNSVYSVAFSPDGQTIVSGSDDKTIRLWNLDGTPVGNPFTGHTNSVYSVAFSPDGQTIVSGSGDDTIRLWNLDGTPVGNPFTGHTNSVYSVAFSPDGQTIVSGSDDKTIRLWKLDGTPVGNPFTGHTSYVTSVAFSPDGQTIVSGSYDNTIRLWNLDGTPVGNPFTGHNSTVLSVAFSPDGQTIVSGSDDKTIRLWKLDGTPVGNPFTGHTNSVTSVAFSPDGQTIVSGSGDDTIRLWKLDGTPVGNPFTGHTNSVLSVAFSPDGQTIVSGSGDDTIRLWKLDGTPVGNPFTGHTSYVLSVAFSPDGQTIVSGSGDDTIRLWNLDGTPVGNPFTGHTNSVYSVAFSPDGQTIVSGSDDNTIQVFSSVGWQTWLQVCCQRLHNNWSLDPQGVARKTCLMEKARSLSEAGDLDAAIVHFQNALRITSGFKLSSEALETEAKRKIAPTLLAQGEKLARTGNYEGAVAKFKQAIEFDDKLKIAPETKAKQLTTPILLMQGTFDALGLDINSAIAKFNQAKALDSTLALAPETEAKRLATSVLMGQGEKLAKEGEIEKATTKFKQAKQLAPSLKIDPEEEAKLLAAPFLLKQGISLVKEGKVQEAIDAYQQAQAYDPNLEVSAENWNSLCWFGSLHGYAADVLFACEKAVELNPDDANIQNSRGLARALTGDFKGAIEDFEAVVKAEDDEEAATLKATRKRWIKALKAGKNPFTAKEIKKLLNE